MMNHLGILALYMASFFWGTAYIAQKILVDVGIPPFYMVGLRMSFALIMIPWIFRKPLSSRSIKRGCVLGFFLYLVFSLQTYGLKTIDSSISAFVSGLNLVLIPVLNRIIFHHKFNMFNILSIIVALIGVYYFNLNRDAVFVWNWGMILTVLCAVAIAFELVYAGYFMNDEDPLQIAGIQNLFCGLLAFMSAFLFEGSFPSKWDFYSLSAITYLGLIASVLCYMLLLFGQKQVPNLVKVGLIMALQPLFTTIIAIFALGENLSVFKVAGMIFMIVAIAIDEIVGFRSRKKSVNL